MTTLSPTTSLTTLLTTLQIRLSHLESKDALHTLINTYTHACDHGDVSLAASLVTPAARLSAPWFPTVHGREAIAEGIGAGKAFGHLMQSVSNVQIEIDAENGDRAEAGAYLSFYATPDARRLGEGYVFGGPYRFVFVRGREGGEGGWEGRWRIESLRIERWWEQGRDTMGAFSQGFEREEK